MFFQTMRHDNENQPLEFQPIAIALARVVDRLTEKSHSDTDRQGEPAGKTKEDDAAHEKYVAQRMRDFERFERRFKDGSARQGN